jgi:hypothetical protein
MAYKGFIKPLNPSKYKGDPTKIVYRSRWECVYMSRLDKDPSVIEWSSEEVVIPYRSPIDNRMHRYFVDFYVKKKLANGKTASALIEIKPKKETRPPEVINKPNKRYINEVMTWGVNSAKWKAATEFCKDRGWAFEILTEDHLGLKF